MTAFGGTVIGGVGGGVGAFLLAKGFNLVSGEGDRIRWSVGHYREQVRRALLGYLAVAHFGRGRGEWREGEPPAHWLEATEDAIISHAGKIDAVWKKAGKKEPKLSKLHEELTETVADAAYELLARLYTNFEVPTPRLKE